MQEDMRTRKLVDQAKGILIEKWKMTEGEAYRSLQKESMNKGISLRDIARAVIESNK
ncbi:MAG TPA: ANTAR domain-containing protein [Syntrophomonadaceae bacterium]|nr:ANTAR domain-containing protein [Syntrophomonadaceae bacterium]